MKTVTRSAIICAMNASQYDQFVPLDEVKAEIDQLNRGIWHRNTEIAELTRKLTTEHEALRLVRIQRNDARSTSDELNDKNDKLRKQNETVSSQNGVLWRRAITAEAAQKDLTARLEAAEAQLKYGINCVAASVCVDLSGSIGKFRTRTGATYEYNPRTKQVLVDAGEFEQLHKKASIYREIGTIDYARDTIVVDRSTWQRINEHRTSLLSGLAVILGAKEGEDVLLVAQNVVRDRQGLSDSLKKARSVLKQITDSVWNFNYGNWYAVCCVRNALYEYNNPKPTTGEVGAGS